MATKRKGSPAPRKRAAPAAARGAAEKNVLRIYTLNVVLISGPIAEKFVAKNPIVSRTIQVRGEQTLAELHHASFDAFDRWDEHMHEFQFGKRPMDPAGPRYVMPEAVGREFPDEDAAAGLVDRTTIDSLNLKVGRCFGYWFDFGDDWWHQIAVETIDDAPPKGKFPAATKRVGKSPPQYGED